MDAQNLVILSTTDSVAISRVLYRHAADLQRLSVDAFERLDFIRADELSRAAAQYQRLAPKFGAPLDSRADSI